MGGADATGAKRCRGARGRRPIETEHRNGTCAKRKIGSTRKALAGRRQSEGKNVFPFKTVSRHVW